MSPDAPARAAPAAAHRQRAPGADSDGGASRTRPAGKGGDLSVAPVWSVLGPGRPLEAEDRQRYDRLLDRPVDGIRVHEGSAVPPRPGSRAWTVGGHVVLGPDVGRAERRRALDHEVVHAAGQLAADPGPRSGAPTLIPPATGPVGDPVEAATERAVTRMGWGQRASVPLDRAPVVRGLPPGHDGDPLIITATSFEDAAAQFKAIMDEVGSPADLRFTIVGRTSVAVFDRDGTPLGTFRLRIPANIASGVHVRAVPNSAELFALVRSGAAYRAGPRTAGPLDFGHDVERESEYEDLIRGHGMAYVVPAASSSLVPTPAPSTTPEPPDPLMQFESKRSANLDPWPGAVVPLTPQVTATNSTGSFLMHLENNQGANTLDRVTNLMQPINFHWEVLKLDEHFMPVQGGRRDATRFDAVRGNFQRRIRDADADRRANLGEHPERQSLPESVIRQAVAQQMHDARLILAMTGEVALTVINTFVGGPDNPFSEDIIDVPFREPGDYFVRCKATPVAEANARYVRATTVAGATVSVFDIAEYAQDALGTEADEAARATQRVADIDAALATPPAADPTPGGAARQARDRAFLGFERAYSQSVVAAAGDQAAVQAARRIYLQARIGWLTDPSRPTGDQAFDDEVARQLASLQAEEQRLGTTLDLARTQLPGDVTSTGLMTGALIDEASGARQDMTFSVGERQYVATDRLEVVIADVTGGVAGRVFNGMGDGFTGAGRPDAVRAAVRDVRQNLHRGRGWLAYRLPPAYRGIDLDLPNPMQLELSFLDQASETADDAAHALTLAAIIAAPMTGGSSLEILGVLAPIQAASSLYRIVDRAAYGDLALDSELIGDFINIASLGLGGVGGTTKLASRGMQIVAGVAGVAVKLLQYGNYVVIAWSTFRSLTAPDQPGEDPRAGRRRRLIAILSALEQGAIPVAEHMWPPGSHTTPHPTAEHPGLPEQHGGPADEGRRPPGGPDTGTGTGQTGTGQTGTGQTGTGQAGTGQTGNRSHPDTAAVPGGETVPRTDLPELRRGLPSDLAASLPITRDPSTTFGARSVHVEYTMDGGVITEIHLLVGREVTFREIAEHVNTVRSMQRYQGLSGRVRILIERIGAWFTQNPTAGPGTRAFEARLELAKLPPIIEARAREMADPNTPADRRAALELELGDLERQLADHAAAVDSVATGRGFVAAEGVSAGRAEAARRGYPGLPDPAARASDGTALGEYIWRYTAGDAEPEVVNRGEGPKLLYEKASGRFVPDPGSRSEPSFGATTTRAEAYDALGGRDPHSEFGQFTRMLLAEGIAPSHEALIAAMQDPAQLRYRTVRSNLKDVYAQTVVDHLVDPVRLTATPLFSVLRRQGLSAADARQAASHAEMLRVTRNLYSSDRGAVAERWYEATYGAGASASRQVTVTQDQALKMGTRISEDRRLDRISGSFIEELKNVSGPLDAGDKAQINDQLNLVGFDVPVNGQPHHIDMVKVAMLDPQGALANATYMYGRLAPSEPGSAGLIFELYSTRGSTLLVTTENRAILHDPARLMAFIRSGAVSP